MSTSVYHQQSKSQQPATPLELRQVPQWVTWRFTPPRKPGGKPGKILYTPGTNRKADSTDRSTWRSYDDALVDVLVGKADGIGFVFSADDPYFGIDLDGCRDPETGEIAAWALAIVERFATHVHVSPTGTGLHIIGRGVKPGPECRKGSEIECYDTARFFTITDQVLEGYETIRSCQRELTAWYRELWPVEPPPRRQAPPTEEPIVIGDDEMSADEIIEHLSNHPTKGAKFRELFSGGWLDYPSNSEARFALMAMCLPYATNPATLAEVLRRSGLWTDKLKKRPELVQHEAGKLVKKYNGPRYNRRSRTYRQTIEVDERDVDPETGEILGTVSTAGQDCGDIVSHLQRKLEAKDQKIQMLKRDRDTLIELVLNPSLTDSDRKTIVRTMVLTLTKQPDEDGLITIKPAELSNDWRPKPERGQNTPPLNPDGSKPFMSRASVKTNMARVRDKLKVLQAEDDTRRVTPKNGMPYAETVWRVKPPTSIADFLEPAASYSTEPRRKLRSITPPCPDCGEVHPRTVQTTTTYICHGCGGSWTEEGKPRVEQPIIQIGPDETGPAPTGDNVSTIYTVDTTGERLSSEGTENPDEAVRRCTACGVVLASDEDRVCASCAEEFRRRDAEQAERHRQRLRLGRLCAEYHCDEPTGDPKQLYCAKHRGQANAGMVAS